jgi:hypothetical protein
MGIAPGDLGTDPTFDTNCDRVVPGREYAVDSASVTGGTDIDLDATFRFAASIVDGRLRARAIEGATTFDLPIDVGASRVSFPMHSIQLRANIAANGLSMGSVGGMMHGEDLIQPCLHCGDSYLGVAETVIGGLVDVQRGGVCGNLSMMPPRFGPRFGGISVGFGIHAIPAVISSRTPIVAADIPGMCGAPIDDAREGR